jgi:hypothetical protein
MMLLDNPRLPSPLSPLASDCGQSLRSSRSQSVELPKRQVPSEEDLRAGFTLIRNCITLGHHKAGMEIFLNLCGKIGALWLFNWKPLSREIKRGVEELNEEAILKLNQQLISRYEAEHGFDDGKLLGMCSITAVLYFVPEILVPERDRKELGPTQMLSRLDEGKGLLERALKQVLDVETVKMLLDAGSFEESLPSNEDTVDGVLEKLILQSANRPFLAYACGALSQYYNLRSRYAFSIELLRMIGDYIAEGTLLGLSKDMKTLSQMGWVTEFEVRY